MTKRKPEAERLQDRGYDQDLLDLLITMAQDIDELRVSMKVLQRMIDQLDNSG